MRRASLSKSSGHLCRLTDHPIRSSVFLVILLCCVLPLILILRLSPASFYQPADADRIVFFYVRHQRQIFQNTASADDESPTPQEIKRKISCRDPVTDALKSDHTHEQQNDVRGGTHKDDLMGGISENYYPVRSNTASNQAAPLTISVSTKDTPPVFQNWKGRQELFCNGRATLYGNQFVQFQNLLIDRQFCTSKAHGNEDIDQVIGQNEMDEYYQTASGCFSLQCESTDSSRLYYQFLGDENYLNEWFRNLKTSGVESRSDDVIVDDFTIALMRREYANLYHTANDWYNTFLVMNFHGKRPEETNILLIDAHPKGALDTAWHVIFNSTRFLYETAQRTVYSNMVWGIQGYNSLLKEPMRPDATPPPLLEEFRRFFLSRFQLDHSRSLECRNLSILFIWRRDYVAHPRNPQGVIQRKIANEQDIISGLQSLHPDYTIRGVQIDTYPMKDQLAMVSSADILIGMHGAGLSHVLFLPRHGALIELVPDYYGFENNHFIDIARWRGLVQTKWVNTNHYNELPNYNTRIPIKVVDDLLTDAARKMCSEETPDQRLTAYRSRRFMHGSNSVVRVNRNFDQQFNQYPPRQNINARFNLMARPVLV